MEADELLINKSDSKSGGSVIAGITAIIGFIASIYLYQAASTWQNDKLRVEFESAAQAQSQAITRSLNEYLGALYFLGDFYKFSQSISTEDFEEITKAPLERYPGIQALGWDKLIKHMDRESVEQSIRASGFPHFGISERDESGNLIPAKVRDEYVAVTQIAPLASNESAIGFDIASNPARKMTIDRAFDTGEVAVTSRLRLVQETQSQYGVLVLLPVFEDGQPIDTVAERRKHRKGLVVEVLRIGEVVEKSLRSLRTTELHCKLFGSGNLDAESCLYASELKQSQAQSPSKLNWKHEFDFANDTWCLVIEPTPGYLASHQSKQPMLILCIALLLTGVLSLHLHRRQRHLTTITEHARREQKVNADLEIEIADRIAAVKRLKQLNEYLDTILVNLPVGVSIYEGDDLKYVHVNQQMESISDLKASDVIGRPAAEVHSSENDNMAQELLNVRQTGIPVIARETSRISPRDHEQRHFIEWLIPISQRDEKAFAVVAVTADATELTETQRQLRQSQKMDALGTLAGGIAHDFNNILNVISAHAQLSTLEIENDQSPVEDLEIIQKATDRATKLVRQILAFSRMETTKLASLDLVTATKDALGLVRSATSTRVDISTNFAMDQALILGDATQIQQIVVNLCTNAQHAMSDDKGMIRIAIDCCNVSEVEGMTSTSKTDECIRLTVRDNGSGIPAEVLPKIFDPFFTTKSVGKGTGLGLAVVHGIVEKHHGHIEVLSPNQAGTTVNIYFPLTKSLPAKPTKKQRQNTDGNAHILAVDDEPQIAFVYRRILERKGYQVTTCVDGQDAWETFQKAPNTFDLVLTDQSMPRMTGKELCVKLFEARPDIPIIMATGFSEIFSEEEAKTLGLCAYLLKPVAVADLAEAIATTLAKRDMPTIGE